MLILVSRDFRMNGPNLPVNTNLTSSAAAVLFTALVRVIIRELPWLVLINVIYGYIGIFLRNRVKLEPNCLETP